MEGLIKELTNSCLYNLFIVKGASHKRQLLKGDVAEKRLRNTVL